MNSEIRELEPKAIWNKFADLNAVPRPSKKEERVIAFMKDFGKKLGLETIEDVFQRFEPTVDLCHVDAEGNEIKEIMTFTGLGDFGAKKIKEKSDFLSKLDIEKEQGVRITRQLTSNRALQKALENPEVKNAIMDVIESSIEEILANQKKVEL